MAPIPTDFMNAKRRVIHITNRGKYIAGSTYNPKAKFYRNPDGAVVSTRYANLTTIPQAIRPKIARKTRSNKGTKRGPRKAKAAAGSPAAARNQLAVKLQRYLNKNTATSRSFPRPTWQTSTVPPSCSRSSLATARAGVSRRARRPAATRT